MWSLLKLTPNSMGGYKVPGRFAMQVGKYKLSSELTRACHEERGFGQKTRIDWMSVSLSDWLRRRRAEGLYQKDRFIWSLIPSRLMVWDLKPKGQASPGDAVASNLLVCPHDGMTS
jgi:hypothetical protein